MSKYHIPESYLSSVEEVAKIKTSEGQMVHAYLVACALKPVICFLGELSADKRYKDNFRNGVACLGGNYDIEAMASGYENGLFFAEPFWPATVNDPLFGRGEYSLLKGKQHKTKSVLNLNGKDEFVYLVYVEDLLNDVRAMFNFLTEKNA